MKKITSVVLAMLLLFNFVSVYAYEEPVEDAEIIIDTDGDWESVEVFEVVSSTVDVDNKEYNARQLTYGFDYGDGDVYKEIYVEIAPLARAFGYQVSYIEETDSVLFEKDGASAELSIANCEIMKNEEAYYIDTISYEDRTYVAYSDAGDVITEITPMLMYAYEYDENETYSYYTTEELFAQYKDKFAGMEKIINFASSGVYTSRTKGEAFVEFAIKDLGVKAEGGLVFEEASLYENGKFDIEISMDSSGFMNLMDIGFGMMNNNEEEIDFDEKVDFSIICDGEHIYLKGDLNTVFLDSLRPYFIDGTYEMSKENEKLINDAQTGWLKMDMGYEGFEIALSQDMENVIKTITEGNMSYQEKKTVLDVFSFISSCIALATKETENGVKYKLELNKDMIGAMLKLNNIELPEEISQIDVDDFNFVVEEEYNKDMSGKSKLLFTLDMQKFIPVNNNTKIGEFKFNISSDQTRKVAKETVKVPERFVSSEALENMFFELESEYFEVELEN